MSNQLVISQTLVSYNQTKGQPGAPVLVFLHGWGSQKEIWQKTIAAMQKSGLGTLSLDFPGFGQSPRPRADWGVGEYASMLKEFLQKLEISRPVLVGHSFGGRVAIKFCAIYPKAASKLVLVNSAGFADVSVKQKVISKAASVLNIFFKPSFMKPCKLWLQRKLGAGDYAEAGEMKNIFLKVVSEDLTSDMKKIEVPTLIVSGQQDKDTPPAFGRRMQENISGSKWLTLSSAGHFSFLDQPEEFFQQVKSFVS